MKRLSSGEDKLGQTEVTGQGQGHSHVKGPGTSQGPGQPVRSQGHPQEATAEEEQRGMNFTYQCTVMILSFWTDSCGQTVQTQIRLLLEEQSY